MVVKQVEQRAALETTRVGEELRRLRSETRLNPTDLERLTGIKRATIYYIENGRTKRPDPGTLRRLAVGFATIPRSDPLDDKPTVLDTAEMAAFRRLMIAAGYWPESDPDVAATEGPSRDVRADVEEARRSSLNAFQRFVDLADEVVHSPDRANPDRRADLESASRRAKSELDRFLVLVGQLPEWNRGPMGVSESDDRSEADE
jgi:transcriptional regulator with XRE-family HTH domain